MSIRASCAICRSNWQKRNEGADYPGAKSRAPAGSITEGLFSVRGAGQRLLAGCDRFRARVLQLLRLDVIELDIFREFRWNVCVRVDGVHRAYVDTCHAINAVFGVNDHLVFEFVEAGDRTDFYTIGELAFVTFISHDVRHGITYLRIAWKGLSLTLEVFQ